MFCCVALSASAVELDSLGRDPNYVKSILKRSEKIVDNLGITDPAVKQNVLYILANRYFKLNDIYEVRDQKVKYAKAVLTGASKQAAIEAAELEKDATLYRCHFEFPASLSLYINDKQIDAIKDGMTYNSLQVQYESLVDMVPSLTEEEKKQAEEAAEENKPLFEAIKAALGDKVTKVTLSTRLKSHPVCLSSEGPISIEMERVLKGMPGGEAPKSEKVLELNPNHPVFETMKSLQASGDTEKLNKYSALLYAQAQLIEGLPVDDPAAYAEAVCSLMK